MVPKVAVLLHTEGAGGIEKDDVADTQALLPAALLEESATRENNVKVNEIRINRSQIPRRSQNEMRSCVNARQRTRTD